MFAEALGKPAAGKWKKMMDLRRFITVDNLEAAKIGGLDKTLESLPMVKPKYHNGHP